MSITINNFQIIDGGSNLAIDVETNIGYNIESLLLWDMTTFKDYTLAKNLTSKLTLVNNREVLIINASEVGVTKFEDIYFIEIESTYIPPPEEPCTNCTDPALGITYNLSPYYSCLLAYFLESSLNECLTCKEDPTKQIIITINLLLDVIEKALDLGYFVQAIASLNKLKKLCSINSCVVEECVSCNKFKQY